MRVQVSYKVEKRQGIPFSAPKVDGIHIVQLPVPGGRSNQIAMVEVQSVERLQTRDKREMYAVTAFLMANVPA